MYRRIVAALDGSASSKNALHQALKLAQLTHGRIHAIIEETQSPADDVPHCLTRCVQRQSRTLRPLHTRRRRSAKWRTAGAPISCFATTAPLHISHAFPARRPSGEEGPATMPAICLPRSHVGTAMLLCATLAAQAATACERGVRCEPRHCRATSAPHRAVHVSRRPADPHASVRRHAR